MKISQREARRLLKRVEELERAEDRRRRVWATDYPGGVHLTGLIVSAEIHATVKTARKLGHAVVITTGIDNNVLQLHALPLAAKSGTA